MIRLVLTAACVATCLAGLSALAQDTPAPRTDASGDPLPDGSLARLGSLRWSHPQPVMFVAFLPDGKAVLTGSEDRVFRLWDRATGKEIRRFVLPPPPTGGIVRFPNIVLPGALSADGKTLATAADMQIHLWDVATGKKIRQLDVPKLKRPLFDAVKALVFAPDGKLLAARTKDETIRVIATDTGEVVSELRLQPEKIVISIANDIGAPTMAFSPDGKRIASKEAERKPGEIGKRLLRVCDIATGKELWRVDASRDVIAIASAPDGKVIAAAFLGNGIQLFDAESGRPVAKIADSVLACRTLQFSPDGKYLLGEPIAPQFFLWSVESGEEVRRFGKRPRAGGGIMDSRANPGFAVSADGKTLLAGVGNTVRMWDIGTGKEVPLAGGSRGAVTALAVTPDGKRAITRSSDNLIRVWDLGDGRELRHFDEPERTQIVACAPDGRTLACGGNSDEVTILDVNTGELLAELNGRVRKVGALVYSPDGKVLATVGGPATVIRLQDARTGAVRQTIALPTTGSTEGLSVAFSPDGQTLVGHFPADPDPRLNRPKAKAKVDPAAQITTLRLWDTATGKERRKVDLPGGLGSGSMALAPDGRVLVCENGDGTVSAWELASGKERGRFGKPAPVTPKPSAKGFPFKSTDGIQPRAIAPTVAVSPDGQLAAFTGPANFAHVWHVDTATQLGAFSHGGDITTLAFSPDSRRLVTGSTDTTLLVWDVARLRRPTPLPQTDLSAQEQSDLWNDLLRDDAGKAFAAIRRLVVSPRHAVPLLREKLKPAVPVDPKAIERLIAKLASEDFDERTSATEALTRMGDLAVPQLQKVAASQPTLEAQRRVEALLVRLTTGSLTPEQLRLVRAIEVLERVGTTEARQVLEALAKGAPPALATREAQAALARLH